MSDPPAARLLVVDDDADFTRTLQILLEGEGFDVTAAHSGEAALRHVRGARIDLVVCDLAMPGMSGLDLLRRLRDDGDLTAMIMMTAHSSVDTAVEAIRLGALQYLSKPVDPDELLVQVRRALAVQDLEHDHLQLKERTGDPQQFDLLVGSSPTMQSLREIIGRLAEVDSTVLIRGETGTGKELVARLIHAGGARARRPFVVVNCTAIPGELLESELFGHERGAFTGATAARAGRIERADGGTLLLDEIGDMPLALQPKLLRFLQERRIQRIGANRERSVDVRVLSATHRDLEQAVRDGLFREDLYHRLATIPLQAPSLRSRREDLPELCEHLLAKVAARLRRPVPRLAPETLRYLESLSFTGNVRELENLLERAAVLGEVRGGELVLVAAADQPTADTDGWDPPLEDGLRILEESFRDGERRLIERAVAAWSDRSNEEIARRLGTQRRVLERRMRAYGIVK